MPEQNKKKEEFFSLGKRNKKWHLWIPKFQLTRNMYVGVIIHVIPYFQTKNLPILGSRIIQSPLGTTYLMSKTLVLEGVSNGRDHNMHWHLCYVHGTIEIFLTKK